MTTRTLPMLLVTVLLVSNQVVAARPAPDDVPTAAECVAPTAQGMVRWQCAARMTRARAAEVTKMGRCTEGDLACARVR